MQLRLQRRKVGNPPPLCPQFTEDVLQELKEWEETEHKSGVDVGLKLVQEWQDVPIVDENGEEIKT